MPLLPRSVATLRAGAVATALYASPLATLAQIDGNVQWSGVSHIDWNSRRPRVPRNGEAFTVLLQTLRDDVTAVRVRVDTGTVTFVDAAKTGSRGPYDLWEATIPATAASTERYLFEITDGADTDYYSRLGMSDDLVTTNQFEINFTTLEHAPVGATPVSGGTVFKVWSPSRTTAHVRGEFNSWSTANPLAKVGEHFIGFVPGAVAGQSYKYFFNNSVWNSDPRAAALVPTNNYNAVIVDQDAYQWQAPGFSSRPTGELVIYQLHVGSFAGRNDPGGVTPNPSRYIDVAARADHLAQLGVNAVMLNPVHEFPGDFSGGYNSVTPWAIESKLGTPDQFKQMVDALHQRGIAVILDVVWNHVSSSDNFLWNFDGTQLYFDSTAVDTPWGAQADFDKAGVFNFYLDSAEQMLTDYRLDGFRVDATMYLTDSGLTPQWSAGQAFIRGVNNLRNSRHADAHTIAEIYIDNRWVTDPTSSGLGFTAQYQNEFKEAVRAAVFDSAFTSPNVQRVANVLDGQGFGVSGSSVLNYFELHDDCWPLNNHQRAVKQIDTTAPHDDEFARGRTTLAQALNLLSRGVPAIVQGTEWLEDDGWESSKIDWSHKTTYAGVFKFYKDLIALRTSEPALYADSPLWAYHVNEALDVLAFERYEVGGGSFVAVANFSNNGLSDYRIGLPRDGRWSVVINSSDTQYGGPGGGATGEVAVEAIASGPFQQSAALNIPARTILLLRHEALPACPADFDHSGDVSPTDIAVFINAWLADVQASTPPPAPSDFDGNGAVEPSDIAVFIAAWLSAVTNGC
ncbi:MAG: alpha amylase N-terminal ig-like domain-containing protein [Phycisphaeraceae bacterium]|nr:alpha amylase N-terminal ig-like domain-containing protein [Phycisphaeraceae bacterium]